jgi:two-component system nitrogen regulation response regulator NtrX
LQKETYSPSGEKEKFSSNIRFISSSDKNPINEIENKKLRKDFFYRLNVTSIEIPPLRKRREDIPIIIDYYIKKIVDKKGLNNAKLTNNAYSNLQTFLWPGNVKQVENFVDWLYIMHANLIKKNISISTKNLPKELFDQSNNKSEVNKSQKSIMNLPIKEARKAFERNYLINQVDRFGGNISKTANFIGMERSALHRKIKNVGVKK